MTSVGVWNPDGSFASAIAELPGLAHRADDLHGAVAVVDGGAGSAPLGALLAEHPAAVILTRPAHVSRSALDELAAAGVPVIVHRLLLRGPEDAADAGGLPLRHVVVDLIAGRDELWASVVDAVGWARLVAGGPLGVLSSTSTADATLGALDGRVGVTIGATRIVTSTGPALRLIGMGERRLEVEIDLGARLRDVRVHSDAGAHLAPPRYEDRRRLSLRRALVALGQTAPSDLDDLRHDLEVAAVLQARPWT